MKKLLSMMLVLATLLLMSTVFVGCNSTTAHTEKENQDGGNDDTGKNEYTSATFDDAIHTTIDVYYNGEASYLYNCVPKEVWAYVESKTNYSYNDLKEYYNDYYKSVLSYAENSVGKNHKVDVKIISSENMSESQLGAVSSALQGNYDLTSSKFTQGKIVETVLTMYGDDGEKALGQKTLYPVCYDGVWYVINYSTHQDEVNAEFLGSLVIHNLWNFAKETGT